MATKSTRSSAVEEDDYDLSSKSTLWGFLVGIIVTALIAVPLSAAFSFATHPGTQQLFGGRLADATQGGYVAFWCERTDLTLDGVQVPRPESLFFPRGRR